MTASMARFALAALVAGLAGCVARGGVGDEVVEQDRIGAEEIAAADATNLHELIRQRRPRWLRAPPGGGEVVVFVDDSELGPPAALARLQPELATEIRYLDRGDVEAELGLLAARGVGAAIIVSTRAPTPPDAGA